MQRTADLEGILNVQHAAMATQPGERARSVEGLIDHIAQRIRAAPAVERPFHHLEFDRIFPDDVYAAMLHALPIAADYRPMSGRSKGHDRPDGTPTRVKIDLFPEYIRHLPEDKRRIWRLVGRALCSRSVGAAFVERLAPGLEARFGKNFAKVGFYPIPILTRDIPGYRITPHTDTHWKGITVQLYLPRDERTAHIGTIFHERLSDRKWRPGTAFYSRISSTPVRCVSCAIAASGSAISFATRCVTGRTDDVPKTARPALGRKPRCLKRVTAAPG